MDFFVAITACEHKREHAARAGFPQGFGTRGQGGPGGAHVIDEEDVPSRNVLRRTAAKGGLDVGGAGGAIERCLTNDE